MMILLKLGGSLITRKDQARSPRLDALRRLAKEIYAAKSENPELRLILGHGSGSFGHVPAKKYRTRDGVRNEAEWRGFAETRAEAAELNRIVDTILREEGLHCISFAPSSAALTRNHEIIRWNLSPIHSALEHGLIPIVFGDTVFDEVIGGTILSTEELFSYLCRMSTEEKRVLLAGLEPGIWRDFPQNDALFETIALSDFSAREAVGISESAFTDVTGGMREKFRLMEELIREKAIREALIFSGMRPGAVYEALCGSAPGTRIVL